MNKKKKILWIEDDYYHLEVLTRELTSEFEIISARSYEQAIEELDNSKEDFSLILLDLIIPYSLTNAIEPKISEEEYEDATEVTKDLVEYGMKLMKHIKQELKLPVPIIVLSIVTTEDIINEVENSGIKRIDKSDLMPEKLKEIVFEELSIKV